MQLKPEILTVLTGLGATETEVASLTAYYNAQLDEADASVAQLDINIASLQTQRGEMTARADAIKTAIGKFVTS